MPITFQHAIAVQQDPETAFALVDDLARTPEWLERCTGIENLTPGPNAVGSRLRYTFREGGRVGTMEGVITARVPNQHLACRYDDKMMAVTVDFRMQRQGPGAQLVHTIEIVPKTFAGKLFSPLIRKQLPKQTIAAMEKLRELLERGAA